MNPFFSIFHAVAHRRSPNLRHPIQTLIALFFSIIFTLYSTTVRADTVDTQFWYSPNRLFSQLPTDITHLYFSLYNTGALPVTRIVDETAPSISEVLVKLNLFYGPHFPTELDALLCDLNRNICRRAIDFVRTTDASDINAQMTTLAGTKSSKGVWRFRIGDPVIVPALDFESYIDTRPYIIKKGERLEKVVVELTHGCSDFNKECRQAIQNSNRLVPDLFSDDFTGLLYVPTFVLRTDLSKVPKEVIDPTKLNSLKLGERAVLTSPTVRSATAPLAFPSDSATGGQASVNNAVRTVPTIRKAVEQSVHNFSLFSNSMDGNALNNLANRLALERMPFKVRAEFPPDLAHRSDVAVLDQVFDINPCGFGGRLTIFHVDNRVDTTPANAECHLEFTPGDKLNSSDHGTHVAGLIGASQDGNLVGINPYSYILGIEFPVDSADDNKTQQALIDRLKEADTQFMPRIINMSFGYTPDPTKNGDKDLLQDFMKQSQNSLLFVVAAGNNGQNLDGSCFLRPACFSNLPNVITVVGADGSGTTIKRWTDSNYSSDNFQIAALGADILSVATGGRLGYLSGTSQAAPQVAAAASLLLARNIMPPYKVKQRLVACSNFDVPDLGTVGGLLDIECALHLNEDVVATIGPNVILGSLDEVLPEEGFRFSISGEPTRNFSLDGILAIVKPVTSTKYIVVYTDDGKNVRVLRNLVLKAADDRILRFTRQDGAPAEVRISELNRWVRKIN